MFQHVARYDEVLGIGWDLAEPFAIIDDIDGNELVLCEFRVVVAKFVNAESVHVQNGDAR